MNFRFLHFVLAFINFSAMIWGIVSGNEMWWVCLAACAFCFCNGILFGD